MRRLLGLVVVGLVAIVLAGCDRPAGRNFTIVSGSENTVLEPVVKSFCDRQGFACSFKYEGSLDIGLALDSADGIDADAVWPASSVWIDLFDHGRRVKSATSIAQMPVVLGVRKSKAEALGWVGKEVAMADILAAVKNGSLKFLMTSATQSNSGASAYLAMLTSALGGKPVIEPGDLDSPKVIDAVRTLLSGVERSSGSSGWLADLYVKAAEAGTQYDAMWNYEATIKETNDKLRSSGKDILYAIYPKDGIAIGDSPLGFIDRGKGADYQRFFDQLIAYLQTDDAAKQIAATGRRIPLAGTISPKAEPDWNFDPSRLLTAIRLPESVVIRQALDLYQGALRKPSLTAMCLDYSGSMGGDGERDLEAAMAFLLTPETASRVLVQWTPQDRIVAIPFDSLPRETFTATGQIADQKTLLDELKRESAAGGTDMYGCAKLALEQIEADPALQTSLPAIVIMTDGRTEGRSDGFLKQWQSAPVRVPVFGITFGDADPDQLKALAEATSGRVFDGKVDLVATFRAARGYN